ncbi:hypothetical protein I302_105851 [Kwoniella bestiolae CBS 10118]|uniref:HTH CENPB-type domain-containing protein n=1 Tax=Kwoniella bestiolae CBS 10118 TaxID=1296100 RepID=A0A1B9G2C8_9TREE|nr:hypothetical protein I302_04975 [Kwoniella bestiolae CBS 10118]OCF25165.1 hypothetical protein I302_04975 [Kwoniella bestiolae CBS 10118]
MTSTPSPLPSTDQSQNNDTPRRRDRQNGNTNPPVNVNVNEYHSPSAYLEQVYGQSTPNTPHGHEVSYDIPLSDVSVSHNTQQQPPPHAIPQLDDTYAFSYSDYPADDDNEDFLPMQEQVTPPAPSREEDDKTPIVNDIHAQPINLPCPPNISSSDQTVRASSHKKPPLLSPFKTFHDQQPQQSHQHQQPHQQPQAQPLAQPQSPAYPLPIEHQQYLDNAAMYYGQQQQPGYIAYPQQISPSAPMSFGQYPPQFAGMQPQMNGIFSAEMYQPQPQYAFAGPPRSRNGSPTSSIASSGVSLARTASTSSDFRTTRPKVKLTYEDKRNIVNLHRQNSSLRQEDIARMYGVDRSTISKIILSSHRWTQPQEPQAPPAPKVPKAVGGRFPAVEAKLDEWMDAQIAAGQDVRDNIAREKAKSFAREIGFPMDRFKASAKWLDKFKDRRKAAGKAIVSPTQPEYGYYSYAANPYPVMVSPMEGGVNLSRSQSTVTLSSSDSSGQEPYPAPVYLNADNGHSRMGSTRSESDLLNSHDNTPNSRSRSQSSPHVLIEPGMQSPSSGKVMKHRPTPLALQRQNSFQGSTTSPSPRRPGGLIRTNSTQGQSRRANRPLSLAASAFGFTNVDPTTSAQQSPIHSPTIGSHSRQRSDVSVSNGFSGMTLSPNVSDNGRSSNENGMMPMPLSMGNIPPLTPITPAQGSTGSISNNGVFPNTEYGDILPNDMGNIPMMPMHPHPHQQMHYATMPNKHYISHQHQPQQMYAHPPHGGMVYPAPPSDFGPPTAQGYMIPHQQHTQQWQ